MDIKIIDDMIFHLELAGYTGVEFDDIQQRQLGQTPVKVAVFNTANHGPISVTL